MTRTLKMMLRGGRLNALVLFAALQFAGGQSSAAQQPLPEAPRAQLTAMSTDGQNSVMASGSQPVSQFQSSPGEAGPPAKLTRAQAEQMAIKNNPRVTVSHLLAMAEHQVVRESRSAELPTATASLTAVDAQDGSRVSAGYLTASRLIEHAGAGGGFTQLITDFGKTNSLVASAKLREKAQNASSVATEQDITIATDQAFYDALESQALYQVARQNVDTRQTTDSQISELTKNKLKSLLDLSFADVNLSQAKLLLLDAENNLVASMASLDAVLGLDHEVKYELVDENAATSAPPSDVEQLVQTGLQQRPDLRALDLDQQAAVKFSHAERDQMLPTITAAGTVGSVPIRPAQYYTSNWWGGIGVNVNIPVFNGFLYSAEAKEASIRAQAASEQSRDLRDRIVRDIHTAWLSANTAYQKMSVAQQLLKEANMGLQLAQTRYQMGLSSIVELSQAQYQQTDAAIGNTNAEYQYRLALASLNYQIGGTP